MKFEETKKHPDLTARFERDLTKAGHADAAVKITDCAGYALCRVDGLELEPEQIPTLVRALRLIGYGNTKLFRVLGVLEEYAQ